MKLACVGLILLAGLVCAAGAENRKLLQDGFNPLDSLLNKNNTFDKIGKVKSEAFRLPTACLGGLDCHED